MRYYGLGLTCGIFQVPVIAVFTKYDQFRRNIKMKLEDGSRDSRTNLEDEVDSIFHEHYLAGLKGTPPFVCLESESFSYQQTCTVLIFYLQECTNMGNDVLISSK
jgi:hypothetical protein